MTWIFILFGLIYCGFILRFYFGIYRLSQTESEQKLTVTVLVPARNEERNIGKCIEGLWNQTYDKNLYEVIIIDDRSIDKTAEIVKNLIKDKPNFRLLTHHVKQTKPTFKKEALKYALQFVSSEIIMTIDADTVAQPFWIEKMISLYDDKTGLVAGLVTFSPSCEKNIFFKIQTLEFAAHVFSGAGSIGSNNPMICNGSNLSYRRKAFDDAGGYDGNLFLPSGDDDLLLQNIYKKTRWKLKFSLSPMTINYTQPVNSFIEFLNQRARWTSKTFHYPLKWIFIFESLLYIFYVLILVFLPLTILGVFPFHIYLLGLLLKFIPEALLVSKAVKILNRRYLLKYFFPAQLFQLTYVLIVGLTGTFNQFTWKDRKR